MITDHQLSSLYAISSNTCFAIASVYFAIFSQRLGPVWMNSLKAAVATTGFFLVSFGMGEILTAQLDRASFSFFLSGFVGLGLGDLFLLRAYCMIGAGRTLVLFTFQPIIFLFVDSLVFQKQIGYIKILSVGIFITCLLLFSLEKQTKRRSFQLVGLAFALLGMSLDGVGLFLTKKGFLWDQTTTAEYANTVRGLGACLFYFLFSFFRPIHLVKKFQSLSGKDKFLIMTCAFFGTFLSLLLYLNAIRLGNLSTVTAITVSGPILSSIYENILDKTKPSKTLIVCLVLLVVAFSLNFMVPKA